MPVRATSALGQEVGKLFERAVVEALRPAIESRRHTIRPATLQNGTGNKYQIDAVVFDSHERPVIIIDPKYIRYTKHNRDKGSWLCVAHYNLRKTHRTIRKSIAVLAGQWSSPSKALIQSFGVELLEVPFGHLARVLERYGIQFQWPEDAGEAIARNSLRAYEQLSDTVKREIGRQMVSEIATRLENQVIQVLETDIESLGSRVREVEVLLKTDQGEMVVSSFPRVTDAMRALTDLVSDRPDIRAFFGQEP